jgi:hypothetical protein
MKMGFSLSFSMKKGRGFHILLSIFKEDFSCEKVFLGFFQYCLIFPKEKGVYDCSLFLFLSREEQL